jgi:nucleoside-diphosphate-sugar epimerase
VGLSGGLHRGREERPIAGGALAGVRTLVIGASGFVGARLAERLVLEHGAIVRVQVRRIAAGMRAARLPIEVRLGDILDRGAVAAAVDGCTVVFNCAKGTGRDADRRRATEIEGVRHVVEAARGAGARVVHVSSMVVYDLPREGEVHEGVGDAPPGDEYTDAKLAGERLALDLGARHRVPVTVIQPSVVYGPYAGVHGSDILDELRASRMLLVDGGRGICNAVYIDDLVTAMLLAATSPHAPGERFLVSGPEHPTWADFFGGFERMLGVRHTVPMSEEEALALWHGSRRRRWLLPEALRLLRTDRALRARLLATREGAALRRWTERIVPVSIRDRVRAPAAEASARSPEGPAPVAAARPWLVEYLAKRAHVRVDKARRLLAYEPVFGLDAGMRLTEQWARWAGMLG